MMKPIVLLGRLLFSFIFVFSATTHFSSRTIGYAAAQGVPMPEILVPIAGVLAILGGLSVALGFRARWGAWLLVLFLVPVTLMMHNFWSVADPGMKMMQMVNFMKNISMLGGALMITYFGSGPLSIDALTMRPRRIEHVRTEEHAHSLEEHAHSLME